MLIRLIVLSAFLLSAFSNPVASASPAPVAGVAYVMRLIAENHTYTVPQVGSMVMLRGAWSDVQPTVKDQYNFTYWDQALQAVPAGHKIIVAFWGGQNVPKGGAWQSLQISAPKSLKPHSRCINVNQPLPWDPLYISGFIAAQKALLTHIQTAFPALWPQIVEWSVGAVSARDAEMGLPSNTRCQENVSALWAQAGLTPDVLAGAQDQVNSAIMPLLPPNAWMLEIFLDGGGNGYFGGPVGDGTLAEMIAHGEAAAPGNFAVQTSNWNWVTPPAQFLTDAYNVGDLVSTQGAEIRVCGEKPCTLAKFQAAVQTWYNAGTRVFEVYKPQADAFGPQLLKLDQLLQTGE